MAGKTLWELRIILSALWVGRMLSGVQGDAFRLHDPVALRGLLDGTSGVQVTVGFLAVMSAILTIPILMVFLSLVVKESVARWTNRATGSFFALFDLMFLGLSLFVWAFSAYEVIWSGMYLFFTASIAWYAWSWPPQGERIFDPET